eukprot:3801350-Prymnesium_polylepis.1
MEPELRSVSSISTDRSIALPPPIPSPSSFINSAICFWITSCQSAPISAHQRQSRAIRDDQSSASGSRPAYQRQPGTIRGQSGAIKGNQGAIKSNQPSASGSCPAT